MILHPVYEIEKHLNKSGYDAMPLYHEEDYSDLKNYFSDSVEVRTKVFNKYYFVNKGHTSGFIIVNKDTKKFRYGWIGLPYQYTEFSLYKNEEVHVVYPYGVADGNEEQSEIKKKTVLGGLIEKKNLYSVIIVLSAIIGVIMVEAFKIEAIERFMWVLLCASIYFAFIPQDLHRKKEKLKELCVQAFYEGERYRDRVEHFGYNSEE